MTVGTIASIWRYPVKSLRGETLDIVALGERGLMGDRAYALLDRATGKIGSAKLPRLWGKLLTCRAALLAPPSPGDPHEAANVEITLPDGRRVTAGAAEADAALSALLGHAVALSSEPPAQPEIERYWPNVDGLALRDTVTSNEIGMGALRGTFFDYAPIHLLTTATLEHLRTLYPAGAIGVQRFRPNLVIATERGAEGFIENRWVGRTLGIGEEVRLRVTDPTPRCVVPTLPQPELPRDIGILKAVAAHNRPPIPALGGARQPCLGAYAVVEHGGVIHAGDPVRLLADR